MDEQLIRSINEAVLDVKIFMTTQDILIQTESIHSLYNNGFEKTADLLSELILEEKPVELLQTELICVYEKRGNVSLVKKISALMNRCSELLGKLNNKSKNENN